MNYKSISESSEYILGLLYFYIQQLFIQTILHAHALEEKLIYVGLRFHL